MKALTLDGNILDIKPSVQQENDSITVTISRELDFSNIKTIDFEYFDYAAKAGDSGYMVLPRSETNFDYCLSRFDRRSKDFEKTLQYCNMPVFGVKSDEHCYLAYVSGMSYDYELHISLKDGVFRIYPVFIIDGEQPYEDIRVEYFMLGGTDADYSGMARRYRRCRLERGHVRPLKDRIAENPLLAYTADSPVIRVRCGWKPAPAKILHQTVENEPPMRIACDFDRVGDILDELKAQGVDKAEICLVGWNIKGHDGRWPQAFPVCEELGGEKKLRALITKAKEMGFRITCHTNATDQYEIADCFDINNSCHTKDGKPMTNPEPWSGGEMYCLCPAIGAKQHGELMPKVAELGFEGGHYVDVLGVVYPRRCYHKDHYVNYGQFVEYAKNICGTIREHFGTVSSEGAYDFVTPYLDYGLYISFQADKSSLDEIVDEQIPFWQLVYHGIVMSNPYTTTMNCTFKEKENLLKLIEYGGRPSYYFYSAFMDNGNNWMGATDALCDTDEQLKESVAKIKYGLDTCRSIGVETEFMENHRKVADNVYETTYSDGTVVTVDYNEKTYKIIKK
ncbi:MAG: hypothetical protein IJ460_03705 [Clostridia bacterium]|nr:hypothetical protein [Clostridia bacterium]